MLAIYKREVRAYFQSFIGLLFIAVTLFFVSLYFVVYNLFSGYPYLSYPMSSVLFLFLFTVPVLSMRILAEEKRNKTDQLILTAPVSVGGIVMGKFLALLTIFAIPVALFCIYPLILTMYGTVAMAESYLAILGFFLYGMAAIAIGIWISSLTESQVIAAVISFFALFLGFMMDGLCGLISETGNLLTKVLRLFDMATPYQEFMNGVLNLKSALYFICLTVLMLFLTAQSIQKRRYQVSVKTLSLSAYSTGGIALVIALIVAANLVIGEMPSTWTKVDLTSNKLYTLTDKTKEFLKTIPRDVTIYVLAGKEDKDVLLDQTLEQYAELSKHIKVEYVDPGVNPKFYQKYTSSASMNSLIVTDENRTKVVNYNDLYEYDTSYDYYGGYNQEVIGYDGEGEITSALSYVLSESIPKVYVTTGHGEESLTDTYLDALKKENMDYASLQLMDVEEVPEDAAAVLINAPVKDFSADDVETLKKYLDGGGRIILIGSYEIGASPNLDAMMEYMGLSFANGLIVERNQGNYYRNPYYLLPTLAYSDYTNGIYGQYYIFAPISRGISCSEEREDVEYDVFLKTSDSAFAKAGEAKSLEPNILEGDVQGTFGIGVEAVKKLESGKNATMVAYGCSKLFSDEANSVVAGANLMLFSNTIGQFAENGVSVSIPVKAYDLSYLTVSEAHVVFFGILTVVALPLICLIAGFVIWLRRRKR